MTAARLRSRGTRPSAMQAACLFALSAGLALLAIPAQPGDAQPLGWIAAADLVTAAAAILLPWERWPAQAVAWLGFPAFLILAISTLAFGGFAAGTGPFFVLVFAWIGLHFPMGTTLVYTPVAALAYTVPLGLAGASGQVVASVIVLIPIGIGIAAVINRRVRAADAALEVAARNDEWRRMMISALAHDIRSPLTVVHGTLELVGDSPEVPTRQRDLLHRAARQTAKLSRLSTTLLDLDRVDHGRLVLNLEPVVVADVVAASADLLTEHDIRCNIEPDLKVIADPDRLEQIITNLLDNAAKHGRPPILLSAAHDGQATVIEVRDHGPGVPTSRIPNLFQRFGSDAQRQPGSVGLGLWITKLLVEAHGGQLTHRNAEPDSGAIFAIAIPDSWSGAVET